MLERIPRGTTEKPVATIYYNMRQEPVIYLDGEVVKHFPWAVFVNRFLVCSHTPRAARKSRTRTSHWTAA